MKWYEAWYEGSLRENGWIKVDAAIDLRDSKPNAGKTKAGDTYCCPCKKERISPVAAITRARHFRRHRASPTELVERRGCKRVTKSKELGETWKHRQVVDGIIAYLKNDGKERIKVNEVEDMPGVAHDKPDLKIQHSEKLPNFDTTTSHLLVRFMNWRRQREVMRNYDDCVVIEGHRWQKSEVNDNNFPDYLRKMVDDAYNQSAEVRNEVQAVGHETKFPNWVIWDDSLGGNNLQRVVIINDFFEATIDPDLVQIHENMLNVMDLLIESIEEHNMWAISTKGMHRYHLKHLQFEPYEGDGNHPDPAIDAIWKYIEERVKMIAKAGAGESKELKEFYLSLEQNRDGNYSMFGFGIIASALATFGRWGEITEKEKKKAFSKAKKMYYKEHVFDLGVATDSTPLVDIKIGEIPKRLSDPNGIKQFIEDFDQNQDLQLRPLASDELKLLQYLISAPRWIGHKLNPHHPIFADILHQRVHSSDIYDTVRKIPIPYSTQQKIIKEFGGKPSDTQIMDLLEKALDTKE